MSDTENNYVSTLHEGNTHTQRGDLKNLLLFIYLNKTNRLKRMIFVP
jgi:hypothetical protein